MEYVFAVFVLGVMVSLVIAKGLMQANDFANGELERKMRKRERRNFWIDEAFSPLFHASCPPAITIADEVRYRLKRAGLD